MLQTGQSKQNYSGVILVLQIISYHINSDFKDIKAWFQYQITDTSIMNKKMSVILQCLCPQMLQSTNRKAVSLLVHILVVLLFVQSGSTQVFRT
jgi:hypothetical protein